MFKSVCDFVLLFLRLLLALSMPNITVLVLIIIMVYKSIHGVRT